MAEIVYLGHSCVRLRGRDGIVLIDPFDRSVGLDLGRPTAHIVLMTHNAPDHANVSSVKPIKESLFVADGPGEYEVQDILIRGIRTAHAADADGKQSHNTVYAVHIDEIVFCHLGDLGHKLTAAQIDEIGNVDVVFAPVGDGTWALNPDMLDDVLSEIEPKMLIPLYNNQTQQSLESSHLKSLDVFTHHMGLKEWETHDKFSLSLSSLPREDEELRIVILEPGSSMI